MFNRLKLKRRGSHNEEEKLDSKKRKIGDTGKTEVKEIIKEKIKEVEASLGSEENKKKRDKLGLRGKKGKVLGYIGKKN